MLDKHRSDYAVVSVNNESWAARKVRETTPERAATSYVVSMLTRDGVSRDEAPGLYRVLVDGRRYSVHVAEHGATQLKFVSF